LLLATILRNVLQELDGSADVSDAQGEALAQALFCDCRELKLHIHSPSEFYFYASLVLAGLSNLSEDTRKTIQTLSKDTGNVSNVGNKKLKELFRLACEAERFIQLDTALLAAWSRIKPEVERQIKEKKKSARVLSGSCSVS
jgi:hypothetical protein